jgi:hypothetical protein
MNSNKTECRYTNGLMDIWFGEWMHGKPDEIE